MYGMETVPVNKSMEEKMGMAEMKMLRWEIGITRKEKIWNEAPNFCSSILYRESQKFP